MLLGSYGADPDVPPTTPVYVALSRTVGFTVGAIVLAVLWVVLLPTSATGQVVAAFATALEQLTGLQADVYAIVDVHVTENSTKVMTRHTSSKSMFALSGALAGHVQHAAVSLYGGLLAQLLSVEATRHERYLGRLPWLGTRVIVPWQPVSLLLLPDPSPLIPQHLVRSFVVCVMQTLAMCGIGLPRPLSVCLLVLFSCLLVAFLCLFGTFFVPFRYPFVRRLPALLLVCHA